LANSTTGESHIHHQSSPIKGINIILPSPKKNTYHHLQDTISAVQSSGWSPPVSIKPAKAIPGYPGDETFNAELYLIDLMANASWDDEEIQATSPYQLVDVQFNALLAAAEISLNDMAQVLSLHSSVSPKDIKLSS